MRAPTPWTSYWISSRGSVRSRKVFPILPLGFELQSPPMRWRLLFLPCLLALILIGVASGQQSPAASGAPPAKAPAKKSSAAPQQNAQPKSDDSAAEPKESALDPDAELQLLVR